MFKRLPKFGSIGVITDTVGEALPIGAWSDALNIRFTGVEMQKMLEPEQFVETSIDDAVWMQTWADGLTTYIAVANGEGIFLYHNDGFNHSWENVSREEGYNTDGYWSSFAWGDTCIFNNGVDAPQIYNPTLSKFEDLPEWGLKSTAEDILNNDEPSERVQASCVRLVPYKSFLVAVGVTESGLYQPNKVWWSNTTNLAGYAGAPNWDYETPASLSGQIVIDPEGGAIRTAVVLNEQLVIYTDAGATAMMNVGGSLVMQFRRLFNKGAAGLHCVAEVNNSHFCISQDQIYQHDGSTVRLLAKDRIEEEFFKVIGKGGRYGSGDVDWAGLLVIKNPDRKEITINYGIPSMGTGAGGGDVCIPVSIVTQPASVAGSGETATFTVVADGTAPITCQWFEDGVAMDGETAFSLSVPSSSISSYYAVLSNPCGSAQTQVVVVETGVACKYYVCSSLNNELVSQGAVYSLFLTGDDNFPYPFADSRPLPAGMPDKFGVWSEFFGGAFQHTDWSAQYAEDASMVGWSWYDDAKQFGQCGLDGTGGVFATKSVSLESSSLHMAITPPTNTFVAASGSSSNVVVTGYDGGSSANMSIQEIAAGRYRVYGTGNIDPYKTWNGTFEASISSNISTGQGQVILTVGGNGDGGGDPQTVTLDVGSIEGHWVNITITEDTVVTEAPDNDARFTTTATITTTNTDGTILSETVTGYEDHRGFNSITSVELIAPSTDSLTQQPRWFYGADNRRVSVSYLSYAPNVAFDHEAIREAFQSNFISYVDPDPNCVPEAPQ